VRIEQLKVKNFRCLEDITINFSNNNMAVIVGMNGVGKTAILDSLEIFLTAIFKFIIAPPIEKSLFVRETDLIEQDDIYYAAKNFEATVIVADENSYRFEAVCQAPVPEKESFMGEIKFENFDSIVNKYYLYIGDSESKNIPVFLYYNNASKEQERLSDVPDSPPQLNAYSDCMGVSLKSYLEFTQWFEREESYENERRLREEPSFRIPTLQVVRFALQTFLEQLTDISFSDLRIVRHSKDRKFPFRRSIPNPTLVINKDNQDFRIEQLSSGEKSLLMLVTDIAKRLAIANPGLGVNAWQGEGIVLIDEIDLHLHPQWQRRVLPALTKTFPNCQFIVTTHSPQVLSEVPRESVFILEDGKLIEYSPHTIGRDSNSILYEIFGVKERPEWSQQKIDNCLRLIDDEKWNEAREALQELSDLLGDNDIAVVKTQTALYFMED